MSKSFLYLVYLDLRLFSTIDVMIVVICSRGQIVDDWGDMLLIYIVNTRLGSYVYP